MSTARKPPALPGWLKPVNKLVLALQRCGLALGGMQVLTVPGRRTGQPRSTPVAPYTVDGQRYLLGGFPRADWVRNARAAGEGTLSRGRRTQPVRLIEVPVAERGPVLRAFPAEVPDGVSMLVKSGVLAEGSPDEFEAAADRLTVFLVQPR